MQSLRQFAQPRPSVEFCELCSVELPVEHSHLLELETRRLLCCCQACRVLFSNETNIRFRGVPRRIKVLKDFRLSDEQWDRLQLPIGLAFFCYHSSAQRIVAQYPSPAGAMESLLDLGAWQTLAADNPILFELEADVEALLVNRMEQSRSYYLLPIDECYRLVGLVRLHWSGFSGGSKMRDAIEQFFASLQQKSF